MRSTGFVVVSVVLHVLAFSAIATMPQSVHEVAGDTVEITMGEPADHAGVADAPAAVDTQAPPAPAPVTAPAPAPAPEVKAPPAPVAKVAPVEKPVEKVEKKAIAKVAPPAPKKAASHKAAPVKAQELKAAVTEEDPQAAPIEEAKSEEPAQEKEEEPKLIPVKEMSPAGVQAATADEPVAPAKEEKAAPIAAAAPAPAPVAAAAPVTTPTATAAAAATPSGGAEGGKAAEINGLTAGGELGKGGATPAGAVDVGQLRQMAGNKAPLYPLAARREGRQGNLTMLYRVTREGRVSDLKIENSSGSEDLDAEAMKAIAKFRFVPGQEGWARHPVNFNLKGDTASAPSRLRTKVGEQ